MLRPAAVILLLVVLLALPLYLSASWLRAGEFVMIGAVGAIGLTLLIGQAGQLSLGHAFFLFVGAVSYTVLAPDPGLRGENAELVSLGWPPALALVGAVVICALLGLAFAPISGRVRGIYLAVATLALVFLGFYLGRELVSLTGGTGSGRAPADLSLFGFCFCDERPEDLVVLGVPFGEAERLWYAFLALTVVGYLLARGAVRGRPGRAWRAVRDNEAMASVMGVPLARSRAGVFAISSGYAGLAGAMLVVWFGILKPDESEIGTYGINVSIAFLAMVIVGGLGSIPGAVWGAALVYGLEKVLELTVTSASIFGIVGFTPVLLTQFVYGAAIILVVLFEPGGLAAIGRRLTAALASTTEKGR
ncbi:MAG: branched-chain amino acid ABC transporter permease [Pseudonocardiaceae bacterium]|nr:branched-chain amino acid ABC transporter permease [Pseudonocardiaceae bacterium]